MVKRTGSAVRLVNSSLLTSLGELCNVFKPQVPHLKKERGQRKIPVSRELNAIMHIIFLAKCLGSL